MTKDSSRAPRGRRVVESRVLESRERPLDELIPPRRSRAHAALVPLDTAETLPAEQRRSEELELHEDARAERFLVLKAIVSLALVTGLAVAHQVFVA